jgi:ABC-2 type transport system ATP-binding protein
MIASDFFEPDNVVVLDRVTRNFSAKTALSDVSLAVPRGVVFGLVGVNGAGKTTLIKHVLGLLKAQQGSVRVFGKDPVADTAGVLARIGYLSEEGDLPGWMRVAELLRYLKAFYPQWDEAYATELQHTFALDPKAKIQELSKGQRARVGLVAALAHRPELLVLDEPSSGLDPIVRRDILGAIIRTIADDGRTVLFSSHLLHEVEQVADHVAMMSQGKIVFSAAMEDVKETHRHLTLRFDDELEHPPAIEGVLTWKGSGQEWTAICLRPAFAWETAMNISGARIVEERGLSLDEIFLARVGARCGPEEVA